MECRAVKVGHLAAGQYRTLRGWASAAPPHTYPHLLVKQINDRAAAQYVPRPYTGRVAVIRPHDGFSGLNDPAFGWGEVVREGLTVSEIPIHPRGMLVEPFVRTLAQKSPMPGQGQLHLSHPRAMPKPQAVVFDGIPATRYRSTILNYRNC